MKTLLKTSAGSWGYLALALACLIQWNGSDPWMRVDWFAGLYFACRFVGSLHSIASSLCAFRSRPVRNEWWALDSDPEGPKWVMVLMALDLLVFLDYGHWHFHPLAFTSPSADNRLVTLCCGDILANLDRCVSGSIFQ